MSSLKEKKADSALKAFLSGGFGGVCLVCAGHPMDLVKVNIQTMEVPKPGETPMYSGAIDCVKKIVQKDGIKGLYRGMSAPLVGVAPIFATCFWGYDQGTKLMRYTFGLSPSDKLSMGQIMFAGGFSAIPTTAIMAPGERIKCLLQIQAQSLDKGIPAKYSGTLDCGKQLFKEGGFSSLFRGWQATLIRDIPGSVGYFGAYEGLKRIFISSGKEAGDLNAAATLFAGGLAGVCNWIIAIPPDVLKSRLQSAPEGTYTGVLDVYQKLMKTEGPQALFKGVGPAMVRAFPANAVCFLGVEVSKKILTKFGME